MARTDIEQPPPLVGAKVLRFIALLLGWSLLVAIVAGWLWAMAPLSGNCRNSAVAQHVVAAREGIGGECTQAAIDRTKSVARSAGITWSLGTAALAAVNWAVPGRRPPARP
ncbi:MAG TPA: hypothetical protein VM390_01455 [Acidimicrobiales bacterium]|nr:hypothetical protein [Acidimicrobiales bacterium]